jgi:predicted nucleic acid-binding protein
MKVPPVVSNSSPLIALDRIGKPDLLRDLFEQIVVPRAVADEIGNLADQPWILKCDPQNSFPRVPPNLGRGEVAAIRLAADLSARVILLDDRPARQLAQSMKLPVMGTLGLLLAAKHRGLIPLIRPHLEKLAVTGFRTRPALLELVLRDAGE